MEKRLPCWESHIWYTNIAKVSWQKINESILKTNGELIRGQVCYYKTKVIVLWKETVTKTIALKRKSWKKWSDLETFD